MWTAVRTKGTRIQDPLCPTYFSWILGSNPIWFGSKNSTLDPNNENLGSWKLIPAKHVGSWILGPCIVRLDIFKSSDLRFANHRNLRKPNNKSWTWDQKIIYKFWFLFVCCFFFVVRSIFFWRSIPTSSNSSSSRFNKILQNCIVWRFGWTPR